MSSNNALAQSDTEAEVARSLWLIWKNPETGCHFKVGQLDSLLSGGFVFSYENALDLPEGFAPLAEFPDTQKVYRGSGLPAFYANRVMSHSRIAYGKYVEWLGLEPDGSNMPVEILARTGGERATDTFHVVERPLQGHKSSTYFFVSGIRHSGFDVLDGTIKQGAEIALVPEPENPHNDQAVILAVADGRRIGWVPDWLLPALPSVSGLHDFKVLVEKVNSDAPYRMQVLCSIQWA